MFEKRLGSGLIVSFQDEDFEKNKEILKELAKTTLDTTNLKSVRLLEYMLSTEGAENWIFKVNNNIHECKSVIESDFRKATSNEILDLFKLPMAVINSLFVLSFSNGINEKNLHLNARSEVLLHYVNNKNQESVKIENGKVKSDDSVISYLLRGYKKFGIPNKIIENAHYRALIENKKIDKERSQKKIIDLVIASLEKLGVTKEVFIGEFVTKKLAIHCPTQELATELLLAANLFNLKWNSGESYFEVDRWEDYKEKTVYFLHDGTYGNTEKHNKFIEFKGFNEYFKIQKTEQSTIDEIIALYCIENADEARENINNIKDVAESWHYKQKQYREVVEKIKKYDFEKPIKRSLYDVKNSTFFLLARLEGFELKYLESYDDDQYYDLVTISAWDGYELAIPVPILAEYIEMSTQDIYDAFENIDKVYKRDDEDFI